MCFLTPSFLDHRIARQRGGARRREPVVRRLLEGVRETDETRFAEGAARERDTGGSVFRVEPIRERRGDDVLEHSARYDDARIARLRRRARAAVAREEDRVEVV